MPLPPPLVVIAGSTASGKTALSLELAAGLARRGVAAEIVSADSRQVYRGMDVGTAKVTQEERARFPHHGLDLVDPDEPFSVVDFQEHVAGVLAGIAAREGVALLVGGTGFYLRAVAAGLDTSALPWNPALRVELDARLAREGLPSLVAELHALAPARARTIDLRNPRRVVRALEIAHVRGDEPLPEARGYGRPVLWLGLDVDRAVLVDRIRRRARAQFDTGLVEETERLAARFDTSAPSFSGIGYAECLALLEGRCTRDEAIAADAQRNVAFSRRQATWFRREREIRWLPATRAIPATEALRSALAYLG